MTSDRRKTKNQLIIELNDLRNQIAQTNRIDSFDDHLFTSGQAPMAVTRLSDGKILAVNELMASAFGFDRNEMIGHDASLFYFEPSERKAIFEEVTATGQLANRKINGKRRDGSTFGLILTAKRVTYEGEDAFTCAFVDVVEAQKIEIDLNEIEARYQALLSALPDLIFRIGNDGIFRDFVAPTGTSSFGPPEKYLNSSIYDVLPENVARQALKCIGSALRTGESQAFKFELPSSSEYEDSSNFEAQIVVCGPDEVLSIVRDVTERNKISEQLNQAQKMEAIGQLAGGIAHDFNNLLSAIMSYTHLCITSLSHDKRIVGYLMEVQKSAERAASLTNQLLAFSRRQSVQPITLSLNELILDMDGMLRRLIHENVDLRVITDDTLGDTRVDPGQMEQVLINLIVNGRDAMPSGGSLTVRTCNTTLNEDYISSAPETTSGRYVVLEVKDTGIGMSTDLKRRIFEPFFTTKEPGKGTGLGLSTCAGIIMQNGGHITVDSEPGQGATFRVYLPRVDGVRRPVSYSNDPPQLPAGSETILIVEDESAVRSVVAQLLREQGYNVLEATNGEDALASLQREDQDVHLLLTDVVMPLMGGRELAEHLKDIHPLTKVLYTSGYADDDFISAVEDDSDTQFIQKPFNASNLIRKVREVLDAD